MNVVITILNLLSTGLPCKGHPRRKKVFEKSSTQDETKQTQQKKIDP
jgi:hypothetical protein